METIFQVGKRKKDGEFWGQKKHKMANSKDEGFLISPGCETSGNMTANFGRVFCFNFCFRFFFLSCCLRPNLIMYSWLAWNSICKPNWP